MTSPELINPRGTYRPAPLIEPTSSAYLLITASVELQDRPGPVLHSGARSSVLAELAVLAGRLDAAIGCSTQLFQAVAFPPFQAVPAEELPGQVARYDVVALITAASDEALAAVEADPSYQAFVAKLRGKGADFFITRTRNVKRIAAVPPRDKLHLFNFFYSNNPAALEIWEYLAGWYQQEMKMKDSEVLFPVDPENSPFTFVNHASWNVGLARFVARQMSRSTFRSFVLANLSASRVGSLPLLYHPYVSSGGA
jgi:hypothetical protein